MKCPLPTPHTYQVSVRLDMDDSPTKPAQRTTEPVTAAPLETEPEGTIKSVNTGAVAESANTCETQFERDRAGLLRLNSEINSRFAVCNLTALCLFLIKCLHCLGMSYNIEYCI